MLADPRWSAGGWEPVGVVVVAEGAGLAVGDPNGELDPVDVQLAAGVWVWQVRRVLFPSAQFISDEHATRVSRVRLIHSGHVPFEWHWNEPPVLPVGVAGELSFVGTRWNDAGQISWQVDSAVAGAAADPLTGYGVEVLGSGSGLVTRAGFGGDYWIAARSVDGLIVEVQADFAIERTEFDWETELAAAGSDPEALSDVGSSALSADELDVAERAFSASAGIGSPSGMIGMGQVAKERVDLAGARWWFTRAGEAGRIRGWVALGDLAEEFGRHVSAVQAWTAAADTWTGDEDNRGAAIDALRCLAGAATEKGDDQGALRWLTRAAEAGDYASMANLGDHLAHSGDLAGAESWDRRSIQAATAAGDGEVSAIGANNLAFSVLIPAGRYDEARQVLQAAIDLDAGYQSINATSNLGVVEYETGDHVAAKALFKQVLDSGDGPRDEARYHLGLVAEAAGNPGKARKHWKKVAVGDDQAYATKAQQALVEDREEDSEDALNGVLRGIDAGDYQAMSQMGETSQTSDSSSMKMVRTGSERGFQPVAGGEGQGPAPGWTAAEARVLADPRWSGGGWQAVGVVTLATDAQLLVGDPAADGLPELVDGPLAPGVWVWQLRWDPTYGSLMRVRLVNSTVVPSDWMWTEPPTLPAGVAGELSYTGRRYVDVSGELGWLVSPTASGVAAIPAPDGAKGSHPYETPPYSSVGEGSGIEGAWLWRHDDDVDLGCPTFQETVKMFRAGSILLTFGEVDVDVQIAARSVDGLVVEVQADFWGVD